MIVDQHQWMGQYTIGHPLFLALGIDRASGLHDTPYVGGNAFVGLFHRKRSVRREDRSHSSFLACAFSAIHSHRRYSAGLPYRSVLLGTDDFRGLAFSLVRKVALDFVVLFGEPPINSESSAIMALCGRILGGLFLVISIKREIAARGVTIGAGLAVALLSVAMFFLLTTGRPEILSRRCSPFFSSVRDTARE